MFIPRVAAPLTTVGQSPPVSILLHAARTVSASGENSLECADHCMNNWLPSTDAQTLRRMTLVTQDESVIASNLSRRVKACLER
jgi:hypothetical protein